jgi:hypothetical protein
MVTYKCDKCEIEFTNKSHYNKHCNRKKSCLTNYIKINDNLYKCRFCDIEYTRSTSVNTHAITCTEKIKHEKNIELKEINDELDDKDKELKFVKFELEDTKKELEKYKKMYDEIIKNKKSNDNNTINNTTNNDNSTNTTNNDNSTNTTNNDNSTNNIDNSITNNNTINQNITIKFGDEDISKLTQKEIKTILSSGYQAIQEAFKLINCNPRLPENINSYVSNLRSNYAYIFDGENFVVKDLNQVLDDLIINRAGDIQELYNTNNNNMTNTQQRSIQGLLKKIKENDKKIITEDKKEIKIAMYNNKENIETNKKSNRKVRQDTK